MKLRLVLYFFITLCTYQCFAQKEDKKWYFGNYSGIDFSSLNPVPTTGSLYAADNSSAVSDSSGNLLFYTNGENIWNSSHTVMINGSGLMGSNDAGQSCLIINQPQSKLYYVFTVDYIAGINGLRYSVVDMSLQAGMGEVTQKNVPLYTPTTEKLAGIYNCSVDKYWLITHAWNSDEFWCYEINSTGLNSVPVISTVGAVHTGGSGVNNACGQMSISKDGTKLAVARYLAGEIELFNFNTITGIVSNPLTIPGYSASWGVEFSADALKLYLSRIGTEGITQFDLSSGNIATIINSGTVVGNITPAPPYGTGALQLGPDNKVYISKWNSAYLGVIDAPELPGLNCNFTDNGFYLGGTNTSRAGLCRCIARNCQTSFVNDNLKDDFEVTLYPNPSKGVCDIKMRQELKEEKPGLRIYNSLGEKLYDFTQLKNAEIDITGLPEGIYQFEFYTRDRTLTKKLILSD